MATVRLEFDLDSDVYPELHAALAAVAPRARAERIRQLASAGLVWENVRIHGAAAIGPNSAAAAVVERPASVPAQRPSPPPVPAAVPPSTATPRAAERASAPPAPQRRGTPRRSAGPIHPLDDRRGSDFVDLAIDAVPVLMDIVPDDVVVEMQESRPAPLAPMLPVAPPPLPARVLDGGNDRSDAVFQGGDDGEDARREEVREEALLTEPSDGQPIASLAQKPATRSRLMRMKEKGLFKNG